MNHETTGGLAGVVAAETAICHVTEKATGLHYRGYGIHELTEHAVFEEVAYLLIYGNLPTLSELTAYKERLKGLRVLPAELRSLLRLIPKTAHPMDVLRTATSFLGTIEPEDHPLYTIATGRIKL